MATSNAHLKDEAPRRAHDPLMSYAILLDEKGAPKADQKAKKAHRAAGGNLRPLASEGIVPVHENCSTMAA